MSKSRKKKEEVIVTPTIIDSIEIENKKVSNSQKNKVVITEFADITPVFDDIICVDHEDVKWRYKPGKNIPAYEVARLLPVFTTLQNSPNQWTYITQYKLERNFEKVE
jgi:hypothetical protein